MSAVTPIKEQEIAASIKEQLGTALVEVRVDFKDRVTVVARRETISEVANWLKRFGFDHTLAVSGVDRLAEKIIEVIYFLSSYSRDDLKRLVLSLKVQLDRENPTLCSLTPIWESANLFERETYEMFGVNFEGHPNLQRLLLQDNWDGPPPLRKDLKIPEMA